MQNTEPRYTVGVRTNPDGTLDYSHATTSDLEIEKPKPEFVTVPKYWTTLYHGSNLEKREWEKNLQMLDGDEFTIERLGLSVIDQDSVDQVKRQREDLKSRGISAGDYDTTKSYSYGKGAPLEMQILVPNFHSRRVNDLSFVAGMMDKYGSKKVEEIKCLMDQIFWKNSQNGRHPLLPRKMVLKKLSDRSVGDKRIVQFVPKVLFDIYQTAIGSTLKNEKIE